MPPPPPSLPPGYQPPPQGGYGWGGGQIDHPQGTAVLVVGILSLVLCQILGPIAWSMGNNALREIDANPAMYRNRGAVQAGRVCGIVASILLLVGLAGILLLVVATVGGRS